MRGTGGKSWAATHIDACFVCRLRLPIAIGDSVVRRIESIVSIPIRPRRAGQTDRSYESRTVCHSSGLPEDP
jgi:hypothetical protein